MERRTSCLQSNVDFLQKTITKLAADHQQKLDAANRQIEGLKSTIASLQKIVDDLQAAQKKAAEDLKKTATHRRPRMHRRRRRAGSKRRKCPREGRRAAARFQFAKDSRVSEGANESKDCQMRRARKRS